VRRRSSIGTLGGSEALADALGVRLADLLRWVTGAEFPPYSVYLAALDVVADGPYARPPRAERTATRTAD
jgi:hypothetical protein